MQEPCQTYVNLGFASYVRVGRVTCLELFGRWQRITVAGAVMWKRVGQS